MAWIEANYYTNERSDDPTVRVTARTLINTDHIRRIACTSNGWARVYWTIRAEPIVLSEPYEAFVARITAANPPSQQPTQGDNTNG